MRFMIAVVIMLLAAFPAEAETQRSTAQINKFKRAYQCPAGGLPADHKVTGSCPDQLIPQCASGRGIVSGACLRIALRRVCSCAPVMPP